MAVHVVGGIAADPPLYARFMNASLWAVLASKDWGGVKIRVRHIVKELTTPGSPLLHKHKPVWMRMTLLATFTVGDYGLVRRLAVELRKAVSDAYLGSPFVTSTAIYQLAAIYAEHDDFLGNAVVNARFWLREMNCTGPFEEVMLDFFEQAGKVAPAPAPASLLQELQSRLELLFEDQLLWQHRELFPVMPWIASQLSGADLRDVLFPEPQ